MHKYSTAVRASAQYQRKIPLYDLRTGGNVRQAGRLSEVHSTRDLSHISC